MNSMVVCHLHINVFYISEYNCLENKCKYGRTGVRKWTPVVSHTLCYPVATVHRLFPHIRFCRLSNFQLNKLRSRKSL